MFVSIAGDENIKGKVLIEECVEFSIINQVDNKFYTKDDEPISEGNTPTMDVAAQYLCHTLGQDMRLTLEAKLKKAKSL